MNALDSAYQWAVNPTDLGSFNTQQLGDLGSLSPTMALLGQQRAAPLDPLGTLPAASTLAPIAADTSYLPPPDKGSPYLKWINPWTVDQRYNKTLNDLPQKFAPYTVGGQLPTPDLQSSTLPQYDPYHPEESLITLKNWLAPQIRSQDVARENDAGVGYSGFANSGLSSLGALNYEGRLAPDVSPQEAQYNDMQYYGGSTIASELASPGTPVPFQFSRMGPSWLDHQLDIHHTYNGSEPGTPGYFGNVGAGPLPQNEMRILAQNPNDPGANNSPWGAYDFSNNQYYPMPALYNPNAGGV